MKRKSRRRRNKLKYLTPFVALVLVAALGLYLIDWAEQEPARAASTTLGASPALQPDERTAALPPLKLPADDAAHASGMEWWYYSGILDAQPDSNRYAFHVAVFVANSLVKHTVVHIALTDLQSGQRRTHQSRTGGLPAGQAKDGFDFRQDNWHVAGSGADHVVQASFDGIDLELKLHDDHPVVAHRASGSQTPGLLDFGKPGISYYYSRPRMAAEGVLRVNGKSAQQVRGPVWFDHQWGEFDVTQLGWNWLALHLSDGSDVMVYQLFGRDGRPVITTGTLTQAGQSRPLSPGDVELVAQRRWTSPRSKIEYAVDWTLKLPSGEHRVQPFLDDSEFDAATTTANIYWEGPVKVSGSAQGEGFMELSGYERLQPGSAAIK